MHVFYCSSASIIIILCIGVVFRIALSEHSSPLIVVVVLLPYLVPVHLLGKGVAHAWLSPFVLQFSSRVKYVVGRIICCCGGLILFLLTLWPVQKYYCTIVHVKMRRYY